MKKTDYEHIPSPGEDDRPRGRPAQEPVVGETLAQGADSRLVYTDAGEVVLTDREGRRRA